MTIDPVTIAAYAFGLVLLYILTRLVLIPVRFLVQVLLHAGLGTLTLLLLNGVDRYWGAVDLSIPVNPVTALVAGFLGLPGVASMLVLRHWLIPVL